MESSTLFQVLPLPYTIGTMRQNSSARPWPGLLAQFRDEPSLNIGG